MDSEGGRSESPQVDTRNVVAVVAGIMIILGLIAFGFQLMFRDRIGQTFVVRHEFPGPAVIPNERAEREQLDAEQTRDLNGGHRRMPIDQAMKAVAARGKQAFDPLVGKP